MREAAGDKSLARVFWIGGSPCAGKTTIAAALARRHTLTHYSCDDALPAHLARSTPATHPLLHALSALSWDAIWSRPVEQQIAEEFAFYREEFSLILEDLRALPGNGIIAEGTALLPELVAPLLANSRQAVWLVPTAAFQREYYAHRPWVADILKQCADPAQAFDNWMQRDSGFADLVEADAKARGLMVLRIDGTQTISEIDTSVSALLDLPSQGTL